MLGRIRALIVKELTEHAVVLLFLTLLLGFGWLVFVLAALGAPTTVTYLEGHANFVRFALPMAAMALGHRLVVTELSGRTQKFLESLPMRPWEPLVVKWCFGTLVILGIALASLAANAVVASFREPIDAAFLGLLALRTVVGLGTVWSFFFAMGLFGKLRVLIYLVLGLGLVLIATTTSLELMRFGPFALLGPELGISRRDIPWAPLLQSLGLAAFFLVAGGAVATLREGSVEERLSKPMSQRELAFAGIASFALLVVWGELTPEPQPAPYAMATDHVLYAERLPIAVGYLDDAAEAPARELLSRLEHDVGSLATLAGWERLPQIRVVLRRSLDGHTFEPVGLGRDDGVLVRANFLPEVAPDLTGLSAQVIFSVLGARTRGRAYFPTRLWLSDGFAMHWASNGPLSVERAAHALVVAGREPGSRPSLRDYPMLRERHGAEGVASFYGTAVEALHLGPRGTPPDAASDVRFSALVDRAFPAGPVDDVRVVVGEWLDPLSAQVQDTMGLDEAAVTAVWGQRLDGLRSDPAVMGLVTALGSPTATLEVVDEGSPTLVVRAELGTGEGRVLTVRHLELGPFDAPVEDHDMVSETVTPDANGVAELRLAGRYGHGARVLVVADLMGTPMGLPVRLLAERLEVE